MPTFGRIEEFSCIKAEDLEVYLANDLAAIIVIMDANRDSATAYTESNNKKRAILLIGQSMFCQRN